MKKIRQWIQFFRLEGHYFFLRRNITFWGLCGLALLLFLGFGVDKEWSFGDFRSWLFIVVALMQMVYGFNCFQQRFKSIAFLRTITKFSSERQVFWSFVLARVAILALLFLGFLILTGFHLYYQGILHSVSDVLILGHYFIIWCLIAALFFLIGMAVELLSPLTVARMILTVVFFSLTILPLGIKKKPSTPFEITIIEKMQSSQAQKGVVPQLTGEDIHYWRPKSATDKEMLVWGCTVIFLLGTLGGINYLAFKRRITGNSKTMPPEIHQTMIIGNRHQLSVLESRDEKNIEGMYYIFSKLDFLYICPAESLPQELKVGEVLLFFSGMMGIGVVQMRRALHHTTNENFHKRIANLSIDERAELLLDLTSMKESGIYFFHDTVVETSLQFTEKFLDMMETLQGQGKSVLYFTRDAELIDKKGIIDCSLSSPSWQSIVRRRCECQM